MQNCKIKLSDHCRDNFFRTANCGMDISFPEKIQNVHPKGEGHCILEGVDHPRATGDGAKILACPCPYKQTGNHSYGTDAGKEKESQYSEWRAFFHEKPSWKSILGLILGIASLMVINIF